MGFFTSKQHGKVYNTDGPEFQAPLAKFHSPNSNSTIEETKKRNAYLKSIKRSLTRKVHEEELRERRLRDAQKEEKDRQKKQFLQQRIDNIERERRLLREAHDNPEIIEKIARQQGHVEGVMPQGFAKQKLKAQQDFIKEEIKKSERAAEQKQEEIQRTRNQIDENDTKIKDIDENIDKLRKFQSNIPDQNADNDRMINRQVSKVVDLKKANESLALSIQGNVEDLKKINDRLHKLQFSIENTKHGVTADITQTDIDAKTGGVLPQGTLQHRARSAKSYDLRKHSTVESPVLGSHYQKQKKMQVEGIGTISSTNIPENKDFYGFNNEGEPIWVNKGMTNEPRKELNDDDKKVAPDRGTALAIIPGLVRREE